MARTAIAYKTLDLEHKEVTRKFYDYTGDQPEGEFTDKLCAEIHSPGFVLILDADGFPLKSRVCNQ